MSETTATLGGLSRPLWRIRVFGGNFSYYRPAKPSNVWYCGWRPNLLRLTWKWYREGWWRKHPSGQHSYSWAEFCWRLPHEPQ